MKNIKFAICFSILSFICICFFTTCKNIKVDPDYSDYSTDIGKIIVTKCAVSGCHNDASKDGAGGLSMSTWNNLFEGGSGSACVIPYRHDFSTMCYYVNTYSDLGISLVPTMPNGKAHLTKDEVTLIERWIDAGAPNEDGFVKFSDNPNRKKFYVANQGCDVVTVFDEETLLPMRYINVGATSNIESPHMIKVSPDGKYWYVVFLAGNYFEKYRTSDDAFVARVNINVPGLAGQWSTFAISSDSRTAYCVDWSNLGQITAVDLNTMTASPLQGIQFYPHGSSLNRTNDTLYVTQNAGNSIYKFSVPDFNSIITVPLYTAAPAATLNSHDIKFSPDGTKYFVTCQGTNEVRVMQTSNDALLATIPVGTSPQELSFSTSTSKLFVTCIDDIINCPPGGRGTVAVIDYNDLSIPVQYIYAGYQPHGIEVDDEKGLVYVVNANFSSSGPPPHHASVCAGRNGNVSFIDLHTLTMVTQGNNGSPKKVEVSVYPYSVSVRH